MLQILILPLNLFFLKGKIFSRKFQILDGNFFTKNFDKLKFRGRAFTSSLPTAMTPLFCTDTGCQQTSPLINPATGLKTRPEITAFHLTYSYT